MPEPLRPSGARSVACSRQDRARREPSRDVVVVEEPLELRVGGVPVATIMRTPGDDRELALGFFLTEGWIESIADVGCLALCARGEQADDNVVDLIRSAGAKGRSTVGHVRLHAVSASCGVCGKRTIEEALALTPLAPSRPAPAATSGVPDDSARFPMSRLLEMPALLRRDQRLFESTGAIHAAGIFDAAGRLLAIDEDVGRHNAVDKVIGRALLAGWLPLSRHALQVSGRVSFEIVQKAFRAQIPLIAAVSGVSSLAIDLADCAGITLVGFLRGQTFNVYTHPERVLPSE